MMNWLENYVQVHSEFESPIAFWKWSAIAAISAVVKDNVWLPRYIYNLYPNIYVMLHAESGLKKSGPVSAARQMVDAVNNTTIITGRSSIQGILKEMGTAKTQPGGQVIGASKVFICSSELTSSIVDDPVAAKILTDLYDRNWNVGNWKQLLKMDSFSLKDPVVTMLTATNEAMSEDFFNKAAIKGGYIARTFVIYESKRNRANSLIIPPRVIPKYKEFAEYLKKLATLRGAFEELGSRTRSDVFNIEYQDPISGEIGYFTEQGMRYEKWYNDFIKDIDESEVKDETGTLNRFGDSVLKVAMLLSLAKSPCLKIDLDSMNTAIALCERLIGNVRRVTVGKQGLGQNSPLKTMIIKELITREPHQISRAMLMKKMWMHFSSPEEFDDMMLGFDQSGMIKTNTMGNQIIFTMPDNQVEEMKKFFEGKRR